MTTKNKYLIDMLKSAKETLEGVLDSIEDMESDCYEICSPDLTDFMSEVEDCDNLNDALNNVDDARQEVESALDTAKDRVTDALDEINEKLEELEEAEENSFEALKQGFGGRVAICAIPDPAVVAEVNDTIAEEADRGGIM